MLRKKAGNAHGKVTMAVARIEWLCVDTVVWFVHLYLKLETTILNITSSPATSLLDSKSHLEKPIKYMKLPAE